MGFSPVPLAQWLSKNGLIPLASDMFASSDRCPEGLFFIWGKTYHQLWQCHLRLVDHRFTQDFGGLAVHSWGCGLPGEWGGKMNYIDVSTPRCLRASGMWKGVRIIAGGQVQAVACFCTWTLNMGFCGTEGCYRELVAWRCWKESRQKYSA